MESPQYLRYFMRMALNSIPSEALPLYELNEVEYSDFIKRTGRTSPKETFDSFEYPNFWWVRTIDGINLLISIDDLDLLCLFTEMSPIPPPQPPKIHWDDEFYEEDQDYDIEGDEDEGDYDETGRRGQIEIYLRGRSEPLLSETMDEPEAIATLVLIMADPNSLDAEEDGQFMCFMDDDGELVAFRPEQVVLVVAHPGSMRFEEMEEEF